MAPFGFERKEFERQLNTPPEGKNRKSVGVTAVTRTDGSIRPLSFSWEDSEIKITRIADCRPATSLKDSTTGLRFKCFVGVKSFYLFFDGSRWYIEV